MEFCHFLFFLVKKEQIKDVKCKAFTTTKLELKKIQNPRNCNMKKYKIFRKNYQVYQCFKYCLVPRVLKTHRDVRGREKHTI